MPDALDLSTGLEKKELLAHLEGKKDPFHMNSIRRGCGTMDNPTLIPSAFDARIVGCICKAFHFNEKCLYSPSLKFFYIR